MPCAIYNKGDMLGMEVFRTRNRIPFDNLTSFVQFFPSSLIASSQSGTTIWVSGKVCHPACSSPFPLLISSRSSVCYNPSSPSICHTDTYPCRDSSPGLGSSSQSLPANVPIGLGLDLVYGARYHLLISGVGRYILYGRESSALFSKVGVGRV